MLVMLRLSLGLLLLLSLPLQATDWPRQVISADGVVLELQQQPQRILSTSVTLTGSLLALDHQFTDPQPLPQLQLREPPWPLMRRW